MFVDYCDGACADWTECKIDYRIEILEYRI